MRSFEDITGDADHPIGKHPEDYSLFRIGGFDDTNGKFLDENNECLCTALETIARSRKVDNLDLFEVPKSPGLTA